MKKLVLITLVMSSMTHANENDIITNIVSGTGDNTDTLAVPPDWYSNNDSDRIDNNTSFMIKKDVFIVCGEHGGTIYIRNESDYDDASTDLLIAGTITPAQCGYDK